MATSAHEKIKSALKEMSKEGVLVNFVSDKKIDKERIKLIYTVPAENEEVFKKIGENWKKRTSSTDPEFFKIFWQTCPTRKDTITGKFKMMFPVIHNPSSGVAVVNGIDEKPDPNQDYKIVLDFTAFPEREDKKGKVDSLAVNWALEEIGRVYNLHVAAGIPRNKIQMVAAVHANAMISFFTNEAYREKYKTDNPNLEIIDELNNAGVKFLVCGQSLLFWGFKKEFLIPKAKLTLTAQTTLSSYQMKGFALKKLSNE
jgi:intracellular sulfur oxidation DsrE/DsrF family protein